EREAKRANGRNPGSVRDRGILAVDSVARRINRESFLLLGGTAALLMQVAHPLVAAGVDQHSDFRTAPLPRLIRTVDATLEIVFGDRTRAERAIRRIDRVHAPIRGKAQDGRAYMARDPRLMLWVPTTRSPRDFCLRAFASRSASVLERPSGDA